MTTMDAFSHIVDKHNTTGMMKDQRLRSMSLVSTSSSSSATNSNKSKRKSTSLPPETVDYLKKWMMSPEHIAHPYPTEQEKAQIMKDTGIELKQLTNWFVNNRKRYWKPRVEARLQEQAKAQASVTVSSAMGKAASVSPTNSPGRRDSLVHVVSSPNVVALVEQTPGVSRGMVGEASAPSEISCSASESGSIGMNIEQDEMSTGQTTEEPAASSRDRRSTPRMVNPRVANAEVGLVTPGKGDVKRTFVGCEMLYKIAAETGRAIDELPQGKIFLNQADQKNPSPTKRKAVEVFEDIIPRPKYRRSSIETWKKACEDAGHGYCNSLPTLEEAARLFGFSS
mmetsp:Transcript_11454/g.31643  ORF Transcript_11454/g.31643 Transcript_11454/m.31643 type:complete len:339 (-) Transcript_11454:225-1241(-)